MKVTELLELVSDLAIGQSEMTAKERRVYLKYLNIANDKLYIIAANGLQTITKKIDIFLNAATQSFLLPEKYYCLRCVKANNTTVLRGCDVDKDGNIPPDKYLVLGNEILCNLQSANFNSKLDPVDNVIKKYITVFYAPSKKQLVEDVQDASNEIDTPIYPIEHHSCLAFGALYYFYYSDRVLTEKVQRAYLDWQEGKNQLAEYKNFSL